MIDIGDTPVPYETILHLSIVIVLTILKEFLSMIDSICLFTNQIFGAHRMIYLHQSANLAKSSLVTLKGPVTILEG